MAMSKLTFTEEAFGGPGLAFQEAQDRLDFYKGRGYKTSKQPAKVEYRDREGKKHVLYVVLVDLGAGPGATAKTASEAFTEEAEKEFVKKAGAAGKETGEMYGEEVYPTEKVRERGRQVRKEAAAERAREAQEDIESADWIGGGVRKAAKKAAAKKKKKKATKYKIVYDSKGRQIRIPVAGAGDEGVGAGFAKTLKKAGKKTKKRVKELERGTGKVSRRVMGRAGGAMLRSSREARMKPRIASTASSRARIAEEPSLSKLRWP